MGSKQNRNVGLGYHQLRILGWYRSRRYANLRHPFAFPSEMENVHKPECGGDDNLCGTMCGSIPTVPHGTCVVGLLASTFAKRIWFALGKLQLTALMGRIRDFYLPIGILTILVPRFDSRYRNSS